MRMSLCTFRFKAVKKTACLCKSPLHKSVRLSAGIPEMFLLYFRRDIFGTVFNIYRTVYSPSRQYTSVRKNSRITRIRYSVSFTPAVSYGECMASCGRPMSTVFMET